MKKHFSLTKHFPFVNKIFISLFPKILDFTSYPAVRANISLLMEERNTYFRYSKNPIAAEEWNRKLLDILSSNFTPNVALERIGPINDGGYFIPKDFCQETNWITIGLGYNFVFENELANHNCKVITFDHTIPGRPKALNKNVTYSQKGWGSVKESLINYNLITLDTMVTVANFEAGSNNFWGLKFDIEGNEWACLDQVEKTPNKPAVIVCELHGLTWGSSKFHIADIFVGLTSLLSNYSVCFVNGNNYSPYFRTREYGIYEIIELTLIRNDLVSSQISLNYDNPEYVSINNNKIVQMPFGYF